MTVSAPIKVEQIPKWYGFNGMNVAGLFPHHISNSAWAIVYDLGTCGLYARQIAVDENKHIVNPVYHVGPMFPLIGSERVMDIISEEEAKREGYGKESVGKAKMSLCMDLYYHAGTRSLLGIDTGGVFQVWTMQSGKCIQQGRYTQLIENMEIDVKDDPVLKKLVAEGCSDWLERKFVDVDGKETTKESGPLKVARTALPVRINAACMTKDYIVAFTCLDDFHGKTTMFVNDRESGNKLPTMVLGITGVRHVVNDVDCDDVLWLATDSGLFTLDTRWPHVMWAPMPATSMMEALKIADARLVFKVGMYMSRYAEVARDVTYRMYLEGHEWKSDGIALPKENIKKDLAMAKEMQQQTYGTSDVSKMNLVVCVPTGEIIGIHDSGYMWINVKRDKIVPRALKGIVAATTIAGGVILQGQDGFITMTQNPWVERDKEDFCQVTIMRHQDPKRPTYVKLNDTEADARSTVCRVGPNCFVAHNYDDGVYAFRGVYE